MAWIKEAVIILLLVVSLGSARLLRDKNDILKRQNLLVFLSIFEETLINDVRNFTATGYKSEAFKALIESTPYTNDMARNEVDDWESNNAILGCVACRAYLASLMRDRREGRSQEELAASATTMCNIVTSFTPEVCPGLVDLNVESLIHIIDARPSLTATDVCAFVLQGECGATPPSFAFTVNVGAHAPITAPKSVSVPRNANELRIVHITDLHYDPHYMTGGLGNCINPVCCRRNDGVATNPADAAGRWGDYRFCDTPWEAIENTLRQVRAAHPQIDLIYHTGDIVDHGVWETTFDGNRQIMDRVYNLFREVFPNIPIYHSIGNHEAQPTNVFAPSHITRPSLSAQWLYDYSADIWARHGWLSGAALTTVRQGGYYTVLAAPGLRIISLNNNDCYIYNWWIMYSRVEVQATMQWLHNTLLAAEQAGERVHILAHIPTGGGSCYQFWSREYRRVIDRFHMIIGAQFNGHSHADDFEIYYDRATGTHAVNVAWNGGGATAYGNYNPNYHYMWVDRTHFQVQDFESYIYSISEANQNQATPPRWFRLYNFREQWGLTSLSPAAMDTFAFTLSRNRNLMRTFWQHKVKVGDPRIAGGCNDDCLRGHVCSLVINEHEDNRRCNQLLAVFGTVA